MPYGAETTGYGTEASRISRQASYKQKNYQPLKKLGKIWVWRDDTPFGKIHEWLDTEGQELPKRVEYGSLRSVPERRRRSARLHHALMLFRDNANKRHKTISASLGHSNTISITANTFLHAVESLQKTLRESVRRRALREAVWRGKLSKASVPQRCHAGDLGNKKARKHGPQLVAGPRRTHYTKVLHLLMGSKNVLGPRRVISSCPNLAASDTSSLISITA